MVMNLGGNMMRTMFVFIIKILMVKKRGLNMVRINMEEWKSLNTNSNKLKEQNYI